MGLNPAFWKRRKVLITGHTGFKGSWLSLWLQKLGAQVSGYALAPPTDPNLFQVADVAKGMISLLGDVQNFQQLCSFIHAQQPEIIIHGAAQALVRRSYDEPLLTYATNVLGTANVLETVRRNTSVRVVIVVTSDKCYENREWLWPYRENEPLGGRDPYSSSKACAELVTAAYRDSFFPLEKLEEHGVAIATVRAGNVIGGGDWAQDRLVPDIVTAVCTGRPVRVRHPAAIRPWQHVLEPLRGYLMLAERLHQDGRRFSGAWNFGPNAGDAKPVQWIVETMAELWGSVAGWQHETGEHVPEAQILSLDTTKARKVLGWEPEISLTTALEWTVEWYRAFHCHENLQRLTLEQINRYESLIAGDQKASYQERL